MIEVIWHGRGGQGAFTAARLLGAAWCAEDGRYALAFPSFGPERRGAPMRAFTKLSTAPVGDRSASARGNVVVYLDETLFAPGFEAELAPGGTVLVNSERAFDDTRVHAIDANGISQAVLGRAIPNTALLAALLPLVPGLSRESLVAVVRSNMPARLQDKNIAVIDTVLAAREGEAL